MSLNPGYLVVVQSLIHWVGKWYNTSEYREESFSFSNLRNRYLHMANYPYLVDLPITSQILVHVERH